MVFHAREIARISANAFPSCEGLCSSLGNSTEVTNSFLKQSYSSQAALPSLLTFLFQASVTGFSSHTDHHGFCRQPA